MNRNLSSPAYGMLSAELRLDEIAKKAALLPPDSPNYEVLRVQTSKLALQYQTPVHAATAVHLMSTLAGEYWEYSVALRNGDAILVLRTPPPALMDKIIETVRKLFANDPIALVLTEPSPACFLNHYNLRDEMELGLFSRLVTDLLTIAQQGAITPPPPEMRPMQPSDVADITRQLDNANIIAAVRRQACLEMINPTHGEVLFQEFYTASSALREILRLGNIDLPSSRWLFRHLTNEMDRLLLQNIPQIQLQRYPVAASFNLNLATIQTQEFSEIEEIAAQRIQLFIELQNADILANSAIFPSIRRRLQESGHKLILDGIQISELSSLDLKAYGTDYIKVIWTPDLLSLNYPQGFWVSLNEYGREKVIFAHCDKEGFLWGLRNGISHFQGFFTDRLIARMTMQQCPKHENCTLQQCVNRHRVLLGPQRNECTDHDMLDMFPPIVPLTDKEERKA